MIFLALLSFQRCHALCGGRSLVMVSSAELKLVFSSTLPVFSTPFYLTDESIQLFLRHISTKLDCSIRNPVICVNILPSL